MALKLSNHHCSRENPTMIVNFLIRCVREANIQQMSKTKAVIAPTSFLKGFTKSRYEVGAEMVSPEYWSISSGIEIRTGPSQKLSLDGMGQLRNCQSPCCVSRTRGNGKRTEHQAEPINLPLRQCPLKERSPQVLRRRSSP